MRRLSERRLTDIFVLPLIVVSLAAFGAAAAQAAQQAAQQPYYKRSEARRHRAKRTKDSSRAKRTKGSGVGVPFPIPDPPPFHGEDGLVRVELYNATEQPVAFSFATKNNKNCSDGNEWIYGEEQPFSGTTSPLDSGDTGAMYMSTGACASGSLTFEQYTDTGAFSFGVDGGQQFEFSIDVSLSSSFDDIHWRSEYTGPDDAKSLNLYNCGNHQIQGNGNGKGSINNSYKYDNNTNMCFTVCPHSPEGERIPNVCVPAEATGLSQAERRRGHSRHSRGSVRRKRG